LIGDYSGIETRKHVSLFDGLVDEIEDTFDTKMALSEMLVDQFVNRVHLLCGRGADCDRVGIRDQ